jgi:hypothetical protein
MKIEVHASNDIDIETHFRNVLYNINDSDDKLDITLLNKRNIQVSVYNYTTMRYEALGSGTTIRLESDRLASK